MQDPRENFTQIAGQPDGQIDLSAAALWIAAEEYPGLDIVGYLAQIDELALAAEPRLGESRSTSERVVRLNHFLFVEQGFSGNREDYYDPRNSYLNEVLDRRTGIPITLSLVYMAVAKRLGLEVFGVGFPGHFLTCVLAEPALIVDPFLGAVLSERECQQRLDAVGGPGQRLQPGVHLRPASSREILVRLLSNLKQLFVARGDFDRALGCMDRVLLLVPEMAFEMRDRGLIYEQLQFDAAAAADFEGFLQLEPEDSSSPAIRKRLAALRSRLRLH